MIRTRFPLALAFALLLFAQPVLAGKVAVWRHQTHDAFAAGELDGLVVSPEGELSLAHKIEPVADLGAGSVWKLVRSPAGKLYAATAMPGKILEITPDGKTKELWKHESQQAWCAAATPDDDLLFGTGPDGAVFRIDAKGKTEEFAKLDAAYVWDLVINDQGLAFAATGPDGKIFKILKDGTWELFYDTNQTHVLTLALTPDGNLLAGTDGAGLILTIDRAAKGRVLYDTPEDEVRTLYVDGDGVIFAGTAKGTSSDSGTSVGQNSVYRIEPDGGVRKILSEKAMVYSLAPLGSGPTPRMVAGTGTSGWLYGIREDRTDAQQLARLDAELLLTMVPDQAGNVLIGTGAPGKVYRLSAGYAGHGTLTSEPLDAEMVARFGNVDWRAATPEGTQVSFAARSGNTEEPDHMWSDWSVEQSDPLAASAKAPAGRFLQYRLTLRSSKDDLTPTVRSLSVHYLTANQAPRVKKLEVPQLEEEDGEEVVDKLKLEWEAEDPNDDELTYTLQFRKPEWRTWITLVKDLDEDEYEWDIRSVPEGTYLLRLEASDHSSHAPGEELTATHTSQPFTIDHAGPKLDAKLLSVDAQQTALFSVTAEDTVSPLVKASYSVDSGPWINVFPEDALFDSRREAFRLQVKNLEPGTHVLVVRATDTAGYTGCSDVVFEIATAE